MQLVYMGGLIHECMEAYIASLIPLPYGYAYCVKSWIVHLTLTPCFLFHFCPNLARLPLCV